MQQADFVYQPANDAAGLPLAVSIFADRAHVREEIRRDVAAAGLEVRECGSVAALLEGEPRPLGEVVLLDCPRIGGVDMAALSRLDIRAARAGAHLVISTTVARRSLGSLARRTMASFSRPSTSTVMVRDETPSRSARSLMIIFSPCVISRPSSESRGAVTASPGRLGMQSRTNRE